MPKKRVDQRSASYPRRSPASKGRRLVIVMGVVTLAAGVVATFFIWPSESGKTAKAHALAPESALPAAVQRAPSKVQEAYRFAIANRDTLRYIPCFCGCGEEGHASNADCYIKEVKSDGSIVFDDMSLG
jgi:Protein of unknown function with PCYCGC motif